MLVVARNGHCLFAHLQEYSLHSQCSQLCHAAGGYHQFWGRIGLHFQSVCQQPRLS